MQLNWSTIQEINSHHFEIERSTNVRQWNKVAVIPGAGNSNSINTYSYTDNNISGEVVYYRIRQVDVNGHAQYSAVRTIRSTGTMAMVNIYPSAKQSITIDFNSDVKNNLRVRVVNQNGQVVAHQFYQQAAYRLTMNVNNAVAGVYVVQVSDNNGWSEVKKVIL